MPATRRKNKRDHSATTSPTSTSGSNSKRKTTPKSKSSSKCQSRTKSLPSSISSSIQNGPLLLTILKQLDTLSQSKQRSISAVQSVPNATILHSKIYKSENVTSTSAASNSPSSSSKKWTTSGRCTGGHKIDEDQSQRDANLIIISTHILNRIMMQVNNLQNRNDKEEHNKAKSKSKNHDLDGQGEEEDEAKDKQRYCAIILSLYSSILSKILVMDKTQLERTINVTTSTTTTNNTPTIGNKKGKNNNNNNNSDNNNNVGEVDQGYDAKSVLGRALLSSMLASLQSMHILSSTLIDKPDKVYAKLMWTNASVIETLLALGSNYRCILKGNTKTSKLSTGASSISGVTGGNALNINNIPSSVFGSGDVGSIITGIESNRVVVNNNTSTSVHDIPMNKNRANVWNEICNAIESELNLISSNSDENLTLSDDETLVEALTFCNQDLWQSRSVDVTLGEAISKLISFNHCQNEIDQDNSENIDDVKPAIKRRRTDSSPTRTRSKTLLDKIDQNAIEYNLLSAQVSELIYDFKGSTVAFGGSRFNLKKWASSSFVGACNGPEIAIKSLLNLFLAVNDSTSSKSGDWHEIMQVFTVVTDTTATSTKAKKKGKISPSKERKRGSGEGQKQESIITIPGNVVLLTFASRLIDILNESVKSVGNNSQQKNGVEHYVNSLKDLNIKDYDIAMDTSNNSTSASTKSKRQSTRRTASSPSKGDVKADLVMSSGGKLKSKNEFCNSSIVLMELLLVAHHNCLHRNIAMTATQNSSGVDEAFEMTFLTTKFPLNSDEILGQILLNDDTNFGELVPLNHANQVLAACTYFPQMHKTIETLINCVVASVICSSSDSMIRLTGIGAAFAMKYSTVVNKLTGKQCKLQSKGSGSSRCENVNTIVVIDAKLCSWAVSHLSISVNCILSVSKKSSAELETNSKSIELTPEILQYFSLDNPLTFTKQPYESSNQEYLGLFEEKVHAQDETSILDITNEENKVHGHILSLFLRVFSPSKESVEKHTDSKFLGLTEMLLRIITCCYSLNETVGGMHSMRCTFTKYSLAADCLYALRKCLTCVPSLGKNKTIEPMPSLLSFIRSQSLIPSVLCCFVELGHLLDANIIQQRMKLFGENEVGYGKSTSTFRGQNSLRLEFEQWERRLWSCHVKLCLVLSRGQTSFHSSSYGQSKKQQKSYFGSFSNKLEVFRAVMTVCESADNTHSSWPLYLPSIHHALVTSSLIGDPMPRTMKDAVAERFYCDMMLQSIADTLKNPSELLDKARRQKMSSIQSSDEEIPLSLRDCRLFVIALCHLPKKEQIKKLSKLLSVLSTEILNIQTDVKLRKLLTTEKDYSGFLARFVTMSSILVDMISADKPLLESLCDHIGPLYYSLPSILEVDNESEMEEGDWYKKESCFMGLWSEWESSALPAVASSIGTCPLTSDEITNFSSSIELAMELGFDSAPEDKCLLLFAAWNASGKLCGIQLNTWEGPSSGEALNKMSTPLKLFRIRDDVCNLFRELEPSKDYVPDTFLSKQLKIQDAKKNTAVSEGIVHLKNALSSNLDMIKKLIENSRDSQNLRSSSGDFVVLESTVAYTSFLISMITSSGIDFLSAIIPRDKNRDDRKRKGSSATADSYDDDVSEESADSEVYDLDEDEEDTKADCIARFHEICEDLGATPTHPDWLDNNCSLRTGISKSMAIEMAESALRILSEFGSIVYDRYLNSVDMVFADDNAERNNGGFPMNIMIGMAHGGASEGWYENFGELYNLDSNIVSLVGSGLSCRNLSTVKEAWSPYSAHRIRGKLQSTMAISSWPVTSPELRAGGEWEILLSDALLGAGSDINQRNYKVNNSTRNRFNQILRWRRVLLSVINATTTATALLRFSLNDGKGRSVYQLNDYNSNQESMNKWYQSSPIYRFPSYGDFSTTGITSSQLDVSVCKCLCLLSDIQSSGAVSVDCKLSAQAATNHLVGSDSDMQLIFQIKKVRNFLLGLLDLSKISHDKDIGDWNRLSNAILENLIQPENVTSDDIFLKALLFTLGSPIDLTITTLHKPEHQLKAILRNEFMRDANLVSSWEWGIPQENAIEMIVKIAQGLIPVDLAGLTRSKVIRMVKDILVTEETIDCTLNNGGVKLLVLQHWKECSKKSLSDIVYRDICLRDADFTVTDKIKLNVPMSISRDLTSIIAQLSCIPSDKEVNLESSQYIFEVLKGNVMIWMMDDKLDHVLHLFFLLAAYHGSLGDIGVALLRHFENECSEERRLCVVEMFYRFLCDAKKWLQDDADIKSPVESLQVRMMNPPAPQTSKDKFTYVTKSGKVKQRCCTYASTGGNFSEQHWYNCYTCGLLWDKGCCSLCAQVCHKGHDVGYSRKSSFFCDCGAEVGTDCGRATCKCLSSLSDNALASIHSEQCRLTSDGESGSGFQDDHYNEKDTFWTIATKMPAFKFSSIFISSLDELTESLNNNILEKMFLEFNSHFETWTDKRKIHSTLLDDMIENNLTEEFKITKAKKPSLISRGGKQIDTKQLADKVFTTARVFKASTVNPKISNETSTDRMSKSILSKNGIERNIIVSDQRGRMIIYEVGSLLFCSGLALANVRYLDTSSENLFRRSDLCILGTSKVKCNIVGLALSPDINSRLVGWGTSDVHVYLISENGCSVESQIDLEVGLEPYECDNDYIVNVEWLTGFSGNILVVFSATSVKVFDIRRSTPYPGNDSIEHTYSCQPLLCYSPSYEDAIIKAGALIPMSKVHSTEMEFSESKIAILLDTGRLNFLTLMVDYNGNIKDPGDFAMRCEENVSFPIEGIRRCGLSADSQGATARSLGEGQLLKYLHQSGLLLYKCASSPLIAFIVDSLGTIIKSFEFMPHALSNDMYGCRYSHWTELGMTQRNGCLFYRATFISKSTKMNQPKMMYIEFNEDTTAVSEIKTSFNNLTLAMHSSFEGIAALSSPILSKSKNGMIVDSRDYFDECIFLLSISSSGSIVILREEYGKVIDQSEEQAHDNLRLESTQRRRALSDSALSPNKKEAAPLTISSDDSRKISKFPEFPLTLFEDLINISEHTELAFGGDCVKDPIMTKRRLSMNSGEFIISPNNDGCTLTVSLQRQQTHNQQEESSCKAQSGLEGNKARAAGTGGSKEDTSDVDKLAIVAVRILLGSTTTDFLPKDISVMGRRIKINERMKKWYDVPLTDEEIIFGIKDGAVSISIGASQDTSSPPLIDSVEVFAQEKSNLQYIFTAFCTNNSNDDGFVMGGEENRKALNKSILSIAHVCNLLGNKVDLSSQINVETLRKLIQVTALDSPENGNVRNHVVDLVKSVESNQHSMQMLLDEGTIQGISSILDDLTFKVDDSSIPIHWRDTVVNKLNDCLDVTLTIVKERPLNYKQAIENLISAGYIACSIALQARQILTNITTTTLVFKISPKVIQLAIFEAMATECTFSSNFANLELVTEILRNREEIIVEESCKTLVETLKEIQSFGKVQAYQCDGCSIFPITDTRYTLEDKNIDLCMSCFEHGNKYASMKNFRSGTPVLVNDRKLQMEGGKVMSCSQITHMTAKLVPANILEQVKEANALRVGEEINLMNNVDEEDDADLKMALKMSLETQTDQAIEPEFQRTSSYTLHITLITKLLEDIEKSLSKQNKTIHHPLPVIDLLLKLVVQCDSSEDQLSYGKKICEVICSNIFVIIEDFQSQVNDQDSMTKIRFALYIYLRSLEALSIGKESVLAMINTQPETKSTEISKVELPVIERGKDKTDPRFVCETHGIPAVRRRCSHGDNKDRRFYVCGMDRDNRCKYFKWADEGNSVNKTNQPIQETRLYKQSSDSIGSDELSVKVDPQMKSILWDLINDRKRPLQQRLCVLLQTFLKKTVEGRDEVPGTEVKNLKAGKLSDLLQENENRNSRLNQAILGISLKSKLTDIYHGHDLETSLRYSQTVSHLSIDELSIVEASLDFLSKIASNALRGSHSPQSSWEGWFALLCEIISSNCSAHLRSQAKKMMKKLCGDRSVVYHKIRDQYVFGFQFMKLLLHCEAPLQAALCVREKARRCGSQWRHACISWATLPTGGLIGVQELISEDNYIALKMELVSKILDDLVTSVGNHGKNWRHFCALDKIPQKNNSEFRIHDRSPICLLLWMSCSLQAENQEKILKLMNIALSAPTERGNKNISEFVLAEDSTGVMSTDGGTDLEDFNPSCNQGQLHTEKESPQDVLLRGASGMSIDDIHAFIVSFLLNGDNAAIRALASNVCMKLLSSVPNNWIELLLKRLITVLLTEVGYLGKEAVEFLGFLQSLVSSNQIMMQIDVTNLFEVASTFFTQQLQAMRELSICAGKDATSFKVETSLSITKSVVFDTASCLHCQRSGESARKNAPDTTTMADGTTPNNKESGLAAQSFNNAEGIRRRLDTLIADHVSSEFSYHVQLKHRMKITDVHVNVSDPRGRFVKSIGVFFSPRPVKDVNELKLADYAPLWQRCGTLVLSRGGSKLSLTLSCPIIAANLKFEYEEFYEKISNSRPSGAIVIHCPRCTRVVNNAHGGVCGNCGEVAFQCRKCRHINYDRLDAFLCVECGYCSSGSFSYDITGNVLSKAVAIVDDEGLNHSVRMMYIATNKYNECKVILTKMLQQSKSLSGRKRYREDIDASINTLNTPLKRALLGDLPKVNSRARSSNNINKKKKQSSGGNNNASNSNSESLSSAARTRSLLNLAIQLRSGSGSEERSSLLPDSLSRLVANITRSRPESEQQSKENKDGGDDNRDTTGNGSDGEPSGNGEILSKKTHIQCEKLFKQMKDLGKEIFEFRRRIAAWKRLNNDALAEYGSEMYIGNCSFGTSRCSSCSPIILKHVLELIHLLISERDVQLAGSTLSNEFIIALFDEDDFGTATNNEHLNNLKKRIIIALAKGSKRASEMIFVELQRRLQGSRSIVCANILGELTAENNVKCHEKFVELSMQMLM